MEIREDFDGVLEIYNSLSKEEQLLICQSSEYTNSKSVKVRKVLYVNNNPIAFIELYQLINEKIAYVAVCTKKEFRRLGYCKQLFKIIEEENIKNKRYDKLLWAVRINNTASIKLCENLEFKKINNGLYEKKYIF